MKQAAKATALVLAVSLLSGCSSSSKSADPCAAAVKATSDYWEQSKVFYNEREALGNTSELKYDDPISVKERILWNNYWETSRNSYWVIMNNQTCFSPESVINAQRNLNLIK